MPQGCRNPPNLTIAGPKGTIWSASWMSGKRNPPFSTEDNGFSIVVKKKEKKKRHTLESFEWHRQTPHPLLQAPDGGHVLRPSQIQVWQDQRADEWLALLFWKSVRWKVYTLWAQGNLCYWKNLWRLCKPCMEPAVLFVQRIGPTL